MIFSVSANAGTLEAIFKNESAPAEMRYIGIFTNKVGHSQYAVTFGKGMNFRSYDLGMFVSYRDGKSLGQDEGTILSTTGVETEKTISVLLTDLNKKVLFEGKYEAYSSPSSKQYALNVDKGVEARFDKYRQMTDPSTPADLRAMFRMLRQDNYDFDEEMKFEFPKFPLQIEFLIDAKAPSVLLASANVTSAGTDAISKMFLKQKSKWFKTNEEANSEILSLLESGSDIEEMSFASFSPKVQYAGLSSRLTNAIQKHLKVEVLEVEGFECEDSYYTWTNASWILKDGSVLRYAPGTECD